MRYYYFIFFAYHESWTITAHKPKRLIVILAYLECCRYKKSNVICAIIPLLVISVLFYASDIWIIFDMFGRFESILVEFCLVSFFELNVKARFIQDSSRLLVSCQRCFFLLHGFVERLLSIPLNRSLYYLKLLNFLCACIATVIPYNLFVCHPKYAVKVIQRFTNCIQEISLYEFQWCATTAANRFVRQLNVKHSSVDDNFIVFNAATWNDNNKNGNWIERSGSNIQLRSNERHEKQSKQEEEEEKMSIFAKLNWSHNRFQMQLNY